MGFGRTVVVLGAAGLLAACATTERPWKTYQETVRSGERDRVGSHGRWQREDGKCVPEAPPELRLVDPPAHGRVDFRTHRRKPSKCNREFDHVSVYYRANADFVGEDRFSYHRIDPESGRKRLAVVEIRVKAPKQKNRSSRKSLSRDSVRSIQSLLAQGGYEPGPADGIAGRQTRDAIARYQRARGLPVTGAPSAALLKRLRAEF